MSLPTYSDAAIRIQTSAEVWRGATLDADVSGSDPDPYRVRVTFAADGPVAATCTCPYDWGGWAHDHDHSPPVTSVQSFPSRRR